MSLYNMIHEPGFATPWILDALKLSPGVFGRYRDAYFRDEENDDGNTRRVMVIHTRCGGGNREGYGSVFMNMAAHPLFLYDRDCDFDPTYADIVFKLPDGLIEKFLTEAIDGTDEGPGIRGRGRFKGQTDDEMREFLLNGAVNNRTQEAQWRGALDKLEVSPAPPKQ